MNNFCTLFDSHYLTRGLAMYESLRKNCPRFHLYIYAFDELSYRLLLELNLDNVSVISLNEFEDEKLLEVKASRTIGEYCWTCTPSIIKHSIEQHNLDACTYLDADLYFFNDPSILIDELGSSSVSISEHRYTPRYDQSNTSGIYCVQFMTFKNDAKGLKVLNWWRDACIEWCYARFEDGKFGDQKYLDDWLEHFEGVHVLHNKGCGIAPWNIQQYSLNHLDFGIVFYHFHGVKILDDQVFDLGSYQLSNEVLIAIYLPYLLKLLSIDDELENQFDDYKKSYARTPNNKSWKGLVNNFKRYITGQYNVYKMEDLLCLK